jgi:hypothetical protein
MNPITVHDYSTDELRAQGFTGGSFTPTNLGGLSDVFKYSAPNGTQFLGCALLSDNNGPRVSANYSPSGDQGLPPCMNTLATAIGLFQKHCPTGWFVEWVSIVWTPMPVKDEGHRLALGAKPGEEIVVLPKWQVRFCNIPERSDVYAKSQL